MKIHSAVLELLHADRRTDRQGEPNRHLSANFQLRTRLEMQYYIALTKQTRIYSFNYSLRVNSNKGLEMLHASKKPVLCLQILFLNVCHGRHNVILEDRN
jgi:hypothetical protein